MNSTELVKTALRVLTAQKNGSVPVETDVNILRQSANPHEVDLSVDELAYLIVNRSCQKELHQSWRDRRSLGL
jgi:hypothetical protein